MEITLSKGKVLLTGHHGYIGSVMGPWLVGLGYDVTGMDTIFYGDDCDFPVERGHLPTVEKDIRDLTLADVEGFDYVIHLAALSNDPLGNLENDLTYDINLHASVHLAELASQAGVKRFLFSSSCSMHGTSSAEKVNEETPVHPVTPYGASKIKAEEQIGALAKPGFSPIYMRNGTVYGISPRLRADIVLNNLVGWAYTTGKVKLYTDGTPWRPLIHVEDVCRAFTAVMEAPQDVIHNQVFHVGTNAENYQIIQLAEIVKRVVPGCEIEFVTDHDGDQRTYIADFTKIETLVPEFQPKWTAETGAEQLYQAYKEAGLTLEDFTGSRYVRLKRIDDLLKGELLDPSLRWQQAIVSPKSD